MILKSVRFRLTVVYSVLLFGLAAVVVGGIYLGLSRSLDDEPISRTYTMSRPVLTPEGVAIQEQVLRAEFQSLEQVVNQRALEQLRNYSFGALGLLFVASLGVGWVVAGRALAPIGRIASVAREIEATDLSRRIALDGPRDELRDLADTFDAMLERLDGAFEAQRRFIHEASHELRNPLAVIRTNLDVALADPDADPAELRRTAGVVRRTAERMSRLVDDLLAYARRGMPEREWEPVELGAIVAEAAEEFEVPAARRGLRLQQVVHGTVTVTGDRTALRQAITNLLDNAVRLAPENSELRLAAGTGGGWAFLSVGDEGPGISAEDQEAVFQRFWRGSGDEAADRDRDGRRSGLGLAIVRQIAERHGGRVAVTSESGRGSTFVVWLPLR